MSERDVIEDIKRYTPSSLKVTLGDGTEKAVAVPKNGNRWARTQQVLNALPWVRIECLDKDGRVLGVVDDDELAEELAQQTGDMGENTVAMARTLTDVLRFTMRETRQMFEAQMRGTAELVQALIEGQRSLQQSYEMSMQVQRASIMAEAAASAGAGGEMQTFLQIALAAMQGKPAQLPAAKPAQAPVPSGGK
jgi:hypothetical protein